MYNGLKCYDYNLYPSVAEIDRSANQRQCIAPTKWAKRCPWEISEDDLIKVNSLRREAESFVDGAIRDELLRQYAILRCCVKATHREKLKYAPECLGALIARYGSMIPRGTQISNREHPQRQSQRLQKKQGGSKQVAGSHCFPSITQNPATGEVFIPYKTETPDTVRSVLMSDVPPPSFGQRSPMRGEVYCFTQTITPGYVKIGYTGDTANYRLSRLRKECFPQAELQCHGQFAFPERMERLVHLQMVRWRRKLARCRICNSTHQEFFEVSVTHAAGIIRDWARVAERDPLYDDSTRSLTVAWRRRIANIQGDITAKKLLHVLDAEIVKARRESRKIQLQPSSPPMKFKIVAGTTTASAYRLKVPDDDDNTDRILAYFEDVIRSLFQDDRLVMPTITPLVGATQALSAIPVVA